MAQVASQYRRIRRSRIVSGSAPMFSATPFPGRVGSGHVNFLSVSREMMLIQLLASSNNPADRIRLVTSAFAAFASVGNAFGPALREQTRAVSVSVYAGQSIDVLFRDQHK